MPITPSLVWKGGAALSATGIVAGAFGSHALANRLGDKAHSWHLASQYAFINGVALLAISQHPRFGRHRFAAPLILIGTAAFSGSIFALLLGRDSLGRLRKVLGPTTPLGGMAMIAGFVSLLF